MEELTTNEQEVLKAMGMGMWLLKIENGEVISRNGYLPTTSVKKGTIANLLRLGYIKQWKTDFNKFSLNHYKK